MKIHVWLFLLKFCQFFHVEGTYSFVPRIKENGHVTVKENGVAKSVQVKKLFITLLIDGYCFRRKDSIKKNERLVGNQKILRFICKACEALGEFTYVRSLVTIGCSEDLDRYELLNEYDIPSADEHHCLLTGILLILLLFCSYIY